MTTTTVCEVNKQAVVNHEQGPRRIYILGNTAYMECVRHASYDEIDCGTQIDQTMHVMPLCKPLSITNDEGIFTGTPNLKSSLHGQWQQQQQQKMANYYQLIFKCQFYFRLPLNGATQ